jgi:hypothetical protein
MTKKPNKKVAQKAAEKVVALEAATAALNTKPKCMRRRRKRPWYSKLWRALKKAIGI